MFIHVMQCKLTRSSLRGSLSGRAYKSLLSNSCLFLQLSFIQHSLMSPEVFCFADYPCHTVAIDILKAPPEDDNREIATWYGICSLLLI